MASGPYVVAKGFEGEEDHRCRLECYGARAVCPPERNGRKRRSWPKRLRCWAASLRQIVETVYEKLHDAFGLRREQPHELSGLRARLAARVALHDFCIWLNEQPGRLRLAFAETCSDGDFATRTKRLRRNSKARHANLFRYVRW